MNQLDQVKQFATVVADAHFDDAAFRYAINWEAMASDKLADGIHLFAADAVKLKKLIEGLRR
jgi:transaldolase